MKNTRLLIVIWGLSLLQTAWASTVQAQDSSWISYEDYPGKWVYADSASSITYTVNEPENKTYNTPFLNLNMTVQTFMAGFTSVSYKIDNQTKSTPLSMKFHKLYDDPVSQQWNGAAKLPLLTDGVHKIIFYLNGSAGFPTELVTEQTKVIYFEINMEPRILNLSIQDQTYNQTEISLNFTINEPTSWIAYSLDEGTQVAIDGNTTLNTVVGNHTIVVYAKDTAGNMGQSEVVHFTIELPKDTSESEANETILWVATVCLIAIGAFLVILRPRKRLN